MRSHAEQATLADFTSGAPAGEDPDLATLEARIDELEAGVETMSRAVERAIEDVDTLAEQMAGGGTESTETRPNTRAFQ